MSNESTIDFTQMRPQGIQSSEGISLQESDPTGGDRIEHY